MGVFRTKGYDKTWSVEVCSTRRAAAGGITLDDPCTRGDVHFGSPIRSQYDSVAFAPDGKAIATEGDRVVVYEPATGHDRVMKLRDVIPPEPPASTP